jgi:DNA end-binding protein Ku
MISFGLVNIPINLQPATEDKDISFHLLHAKDQGRIKNQRVCSKCGEVVPYADIVRGFEYEKGSYVVLTEEELESVPVPSSDTIAIEDFVEPSEIDPLYYDKPYYIQPDKKAGKAFALLYQALKDTGKVGLAKVTLRTKEHLAAVQAGDKTLMLYTMHFADEIRELESTAIPDGEVNPRELKMAETLIDSMSGRFEPEKYENDYGKALRNLINEKKNGLPHKKEQARAEATEVMDLMQYLKASIEKSARKNGSRGVKKTEEKKHTPEKTKRRAKTAAA